MRGKWLKGLFFSLVAVMAVTLPVSAASGRPDGHPYDSPDITVSPNGEGWTTNYMDRSQLFYGYGHEIYVNAPHSLKQELGQGEHYYGELVEGADIPVEKWVSSYPYGCCIHTGSHFDKSEFGYPYEEPSNCLKLYYTGWIAYCADCHEPINIYVYGNADTMARLKWFPTDKRYYYMCPWCGGMEVGAGPNHTCKKVSNNQYRILYDANTDGGLYGGHVPYSLHMWDNAMQYDGETVVPVTRLQENGFFREGYEFTGWNTRPDGHGRMYGEGQTVLNLCDRDWKHDGQGGHHHPVCAVETFREHTGHRP